jgi:hypothetical protein
MGCCGQKDGVINTLKTIASGYAHKTLHDIFFVRGKVSDQAEQRMAICIACEFQTWMKKADYLKWLASHGIEVLEHLNRLSELPLLDKHDYAQGLSMFCRDCKCWLPAKTFVPDADCPRNKWKNLTGE